MPKSFAVRTPAWSAPVWPPEITFSSIGCLPRLKGTVKVGEKEDSSQNCMVSGDLKKRGACPSVYYPKKTDSTVLKGHPGSVLFAPVDKTCPSPASIWYIFIKTVSQSLLVRPPMIFMCLRISYLLPKHYRFWAAGGGKVGAIQGTIGAGGKGGQGGRVCSRQPPGSTASAFCA